MGGSMKILFVDTALQGHHATYLQSLLNAAGGECVVCAPAGGEAIYTRAARFYPISELKTSWKAYWKNLFLLVKIARIEKPDIVHLVYGDAWFRFAGIGLSLIPGKKVMTCHQIRHWDRLSIHIYRKFSKWARFLVFHTEDLTERMRERGIHHAVHIEYPQFNVNMAISREAARQKIGIPNNDTPVILALGGTGILKGLDILLQALNHVESPFYLLVAGKPVDFSVDYIREQSRAYQERVLLKPYFLSEEEVDDCLKACDVVCLPYRRKFDGASGPMGEGVVRSKLIVGPNHGSLGKTIRDHHLGITFETEDVNSLANALEHALKLKWKPDERYEAYQSQLDPKRFEAEYAKLYAGIME